MKKNFLLVVLLVGAVGNIWAVNPVPYTESLGFSFKISGNTGGSGTSIMTVYDEEGIQQRQATWVSGDPVESSLGLAKLRPGKTYEVNFWGLGPTAYWMSFDAPSGYQVYVDGVATDLVSRTTIGGWYLHYYTVELRPIGSSGGGAWGSFSGIKIGQSITWEVGLGDLRTGRGAGTIVFKESDLSNSPVSRERLYYMAPPSNVGQIVVVRDGPSNQTLRQILTPIGFTDIVDEVSGGYTINFRFWSDVTGWDGTKYTFGGTPWKTIRVQSPGANQLKITESEGASSPVVRVHELSGTSTAASATATGGTITDILTSSSSYRIHTFTAGGTFTPSVNLSGLEYLVVGGGGGGGDSITQHFSGGGGGGGSVSYATNASFGSGIAYTVVVGAGGAHGANGGNSSFNGTTAYGGGHGHSSNAAATSGGSGGGGSANQSGAAAGSGSNVNVGGHGDNGSHAWQGGGGGGAGGAGGGLYTSGNFNGGVGLAHAISGTLTYYGGGGGGGTDNAGNATSGGAGGGGGNSTGKTGGSGVVNTGGGGAGAGYDNLSGIPYNGGSGGSGLVIIRYPIVGSGYYTWTLQEGDGTTVLRTTKHTITYPAANERNDVVEVLTGVSGTVVAKTKYHYVDQGWDEELISVTTDPDAANPTERTTTYEYYTNSADRGDYRKIKSVTEPTGNWVAYDYYDDWDRRGRVAIQFQPWLDTPATASVSATTGRLLYFNYAQDWSGRYSRPSTRIERINTAVTGYIDWAYGDTTVSGQPIVYATMRSYRNSTDYHSDYTANYRADADPDLAGLPYVAKPANLTQTSVSISRGTFDDMTKVFSVGSSGDHWREVRFNGTTATSGTDAVTSFDGQSCETIRMVPNQSTATVTIRIAQGYVYRTETWVWTGPTNGFQLMTWVNFTWDAVGQMTQRWANNGALTQYQYTKGRMDRVLDEGGAITDYAYDELGRVKWSRRNAATASGFTLPGDIYTHYVYDGADRVVKTVVTASSTLPSPSGPMDLEGTTTIDLAGRVTQTVAPGGYTTGYSYTSGGKVVTATLPGGATKIVEVYRDGQTKSQTGTGQVGQFYTPRIDSSGYRVVDNYLGSSGSAAWRGLTYDWVGRLYQDWRWGGNGSYYSEFYVYNGKAQLDYIWHNDGKANYCYEYNTLGAIRAEGDDLNGNSLLDRSGSDRVTEYNSYYFNYSGGWWFEKTTSTYATSGSGTATQLSKQNWQLSNLPLDILSYSYSYDGFGNATVAAQHVDRGRKKITTTVNAPNSTIDAVQVTYNGLLVSATDTAGIEMKYGYDELGRQDKVFDPRTVGSGSGSPFATTTAFKSKSNEIDTITDPAGIVQATYTYDTAGRVASVTNALSKVARYAYNTRSQKTQEWGTATYPAEYVYDALGRLSQQNTYAQSTANFTTSTWPTSPNNAQTTTWNYDAASGVLTSKTDAAGKSVTYTYTGAGQLASREWARLKTGTSDRVKATYTYSTTTRELTDVTYNDGTPSLVYTYNRLGQTATVNDGGIGYTRTFNYNLGGTLELQNEVLGAGSGDFYSNRRLTYGYDSTTTGALGRPTALKLGTSSTDNLYQATTYGYAADGRLNSVAAAGQTFSYVYTANSHLIEEVKNTALTYSDKRLYDPKSNWLVDRETKWGSGGSATRAKFAYAQDNLGRVTSVTKTGTLFDVYGPGSPYGLKTTYGYNDRSELTSENTTDLATSPVDLTGRQTSYAYDQLGNRTAVTKARPSGDAGGNLSFNYNPSSYEINSLNQYRRRTVPGVYDVALMSSASSVTADGGGMVKQGLYFFRGHPLNNSSGPVFDNLTITPSSGTGGSIDAFLPHTNEDFSYDDDGNLTRDGRWVYQYDAENRLVAMFTRGAPEDANKTAAANVAVWGSGLLQQKLLFTYDYLGRRVQKVTYHWTGSAWALDDQTKFVYNGWNCIATLNAASSNAVIADYYWGLDLSGTSQGAGGIGGLLLVKEGSNSYLPVYDALGNVHALLTAASVTLSGTNYAAGDIVAAYEYDAFGNTLRESGPYAASNLFRFATKYADLETGLIYHDTRYYSPSLGRFINRDTIGEQGGLNLYAYVSNHVPNSFDLLGQDEFLSWDSSDGNWYISGAPSGWEIEQSKIGAAGNITWGSSPQFSDMSDQMAFETAAWKWENMSDADKTSVLNNMNLANARINILETAARGERGLSLLTGSAGFAITDSQGNYILQALKNEETGKIELTDPIGSQGDFLDAFSVASGQSGVGVASSSISGKGSGAAGITIIYIKDGDSKRDEKFTIGLNKMKDMLEKKLVGYGVEIRTVNSIKAAEKLANNNSYNFNFVIAHGIYENGNYTGNVSTNGGFIPDSRMDRSPFFDGSFHCGQGIGGSTITLADIYPKIRDNVINFIQPIYETYPNRAFGW